MFKLQFENSRGQSIELFGRPFSLMSVEGIGDVGAVVQTQKSPFQDGVTLIDALLDPRHMTIELKIHGTDAADTESKRRFLASVFNPKLGLGTLKYVRDTEEKTLSVIAESVPFFPDKSTNRGATFQKSIIYLMAPNPYWKSETITEEPAFEPLFEFPFGGDFEMGMQRDERTIFNDGDAPAPITVEFFGPALNPSIRNDTTGEFIKVNQELQENERMIIDTSDEEVSVYFVDSLGVERDVFNWIDLGSKFFKLQIGENDIEYSADSNVQGAIVNISYKKLYIAV